MNSPSATPSAIRRYDLDWLRVLAFGLLIFYHTGMFFVGWDWHIKNNVISDAIEFPMRFSSQWRMSLLFMISGAAVYFALGRRSAGAFAGERVRRILLPLVFGMLVIVPPQIYFERLTQGQTYSYLGFYPSVFDFQPYPKGNFSWHHLWYLAYIFVYSLVSLPLLKYLQSPKGKAVVYQMVRLFSQPLVMLLLPVLWLGIGETLLRERWDSTNDLIHDWANHFQYLTLFLIGFVFVAQQKFAQTTEKFRYYTLALSIVMLTILYSVYWRDWQRVSGIEMSFYWFLSSANRWWWLLTILGFAKKHLSFSTSGLRYANEAVYPFYILHQTVIICLAYPMINWPFSVGLKFLMISTGTFLVCLLLYEFLIRRVTFLRPLFGLKTGAKVPQKPVAQMASAR